MDTQLHPILSHYIAWLKAHERLVIIAGLMFFGAHFYTKGFDYLAKRDQTQAQIAKDSAQIAAQKVLDDQQINKQALEQLAQLQTSFNSLSLQVSQSMRQRAAHTIDEKRISDSSSSAELASIIQKHLGVGTIKVEPSTSSLPDTLQYSLDAAHADADKLADLEQAQGDVKDLNIKLLAGQGLADKQADTINGLNRQIVDDATALDTEKKSHQTDVMELKHKNRTAWLHGFKWGAIVGVTGYEAVRIFLAHKP